MANYVSKHTGAAIDSAVDKVPLIEGQVTALTEEIAKFGGGDQTLSGTSIDVPDGNIKNYRIDIDANSIGVNIVDVFTRGENMLDFFGGSAAAGADVIKEGFEKTVDGITVKVQNGRVIATGTNTSADWNSYLVVRYTGAHNLPFLPDDTYTLPAGFTVWLGKYDGTGTSNKHDMFSTGGGNNYIARWYLTCAPGATVNVNLPLTLLRGNTAATDYIPYEGTKTMITLPVTSYGGYIDGSTGMLVNTMDASGNKLAAPVETAIPGLPNAPAWTNTRLFANTGDMTITVGFDIIQVIENLRKQIEGGVGVGFNYKAYGLPILYMKGDISSMTKDVEATLTYVYGDRTGTLTCKWQGSSSLTYQKKNYTVKFDNAFEVVEGWGAQKKYCLKANYIDHSHARNIINAKLWGQIVKSRSTVPTKLANLVNGGAIDGFPCIIVMNNEFLGLFTFNIPKEGWMYGMGSGTQECILCADAWTDATGFKANAVVDEDFSLEYVTNENDKGWVTTSLNRLINACVNSNGSDLDTTVAQYLDWQSAIDYYIFCVLVEGADMTQKNYLLSTFDGTKWFFGAYDMDCTYGLHWNGGSWLAADNTPSFAEYANVHRVMELIKLYKKDALKARYAELRETVMSESNVATMFANFCGQIGKPVYLEEAKKWPMIPNTSTNDVAQIRDYYRMRVAYADKWMEQL